MKQKSDLIQSLIKIVKTNQGYYSNKGTNPLIALIGSPGSGKSTQAQKIVKAISKRYKVKYINIGDILRKSSAKKVQRIMDEGYLVPDELVFELLKKELKVKKTFIVLDGFFRTDNETEWLLINQKSLGIDIGEILDIYVPEKEAIERLGRRGRMDDQASDVKNRMKIYRLQRESVSKVLKKYGIKISEINGVGTIEDVFARIGKALSWCCPGWECVDMSLVVEEKSNE